LNGLGGPVSFHHRFVKGLEERGYQLEESPLSDRCRAVLVIGGTSRVDVLWRAKRNGVRIVQRLNGMNWIHRKQKVDWKYFLRCEYNNRLLAFIRRRFADRIIYQSEFARSWWHTVYKVAPVPDRILYNGVDLEIYSPEGEGRPPEDHIRLLLVEAHVGGGYERGLENAIRLVQLLGPKVSQPVELMVVGEVADDLRAYWDERAGIWINWKGVVPRESIPSIDRSAHLLFSSDLNAACPNSVIEALACGLPVIGFATGSLPELVEGDTGRVVPYGSNYWNLEPPEVLGLVDSAVDILNNLNHFRQEARRRAVTIFSDDQMVDGYLDTLVGPMNKA
jgi:glycosyltransferase involved in cell wall biosynthesis